MKKLTIIISLLASVCLVFLACNGTNSLSKDGAGNGSLGLNFCDFSGVYQVGWPNHNCFDVGDAQMVVINEGDSITIDMQALPGSFNPCGFVATGTIDCATGEFTATGATNYGEPVTMDGNMKTVLGTATIAGCGRSDTWDGSYVDGDDWSHCDND